MRKAVKQVLVLIALLVTFCVIYRLSVSRNYTLSIPLENGQEEMTEEEIQVSPERPEILTVGRPEIRDGMLRLPVRPGGEGKTGLTIRGKDGKETTLRTLRVSPMRTVIDEFTGDFSGDEAILIAVTVFWMLMSSIMIWHYRLLRGPSFYSYAAIYYAGFFLFALVTSLTMLYVTVRHLINPMQYTLMEAYRTMNSASARFMELTTPLILLFSLSMAISNIELLRHERPGIQNVLGLLVSLALVAGEALGWFLFTREFSGPEWARGLHSTLVNTYATVFIYFECMLMGSVICGIQATRLQPDMDKDFIVILGCWFRPDGTLTPLLRGRVDRALNFWDAQKQETGREAFFVPSGGQGEDEPMPEAEAMKRYLVSQGVPEGRILPETRSATTQQNMAFSKGIIREVNPTGKTVFATTNYHLFRSGICASQAGLPAVGIGSRTKWWFWPNAFMRETVGLLTRRWWQELLFLGLLIAFFSALSIILG